MSCLSNSWCWCHLPPLGHIWDVMLVWRKGNINKTVFVLWHHTVYYYNDAQWYEQFLQVGRLYWALILLDLALCLPSASASSVSMVLCRYKKFCLLTSVSLTFSELSLVGLALVLVVVLQYYDTVSWVIWSTRIVPEMTCMSSEMLYHTLAIAQILVTYC